MKMLIASQWTDSADRRTTAVRNPGTGEIIDEVPLAAEADVDRALKSAAQGSARMRALPAHQRSAVLTRAAAAMQSRNEELATLLARENGKPISQTRAEVEVAGRLFSGFAEEGRRMFGRTIPMDAVPGNERHFRHDHQAAPRGGRSDRSLQLPRGAVRPQGRRRTGRRQRGHREAAQRLSAHPAQDRRDPRGRRPPARGAPDDHRPG